MDPTTKTGSQRADDLTCRIRRQDNASDQVENNDGQKGLVHMQEDNAPEIDEADEFEKSTLEAKTPTHLHTDTTKT